MPLSTAVKQTCYLCGGTDLKPRKGTVRDDPSIGILECAGCGLVALDRRDHVTIADYEASRMHGEAMASAASMALWLAETKQDDERRFEMLQASILNRRVLDVGCGAGGFLLNAKPHAALVEGVEPERRVRDHYAGSLRLHRSLDDVAGQQFDLVTAFHVVEHLPDPRAVLRQMRGVMAPGGRIVIEVPSADDALLGLYDCAPFQAFSYWSQHLFLFTADTLAQVAVQAGLRVSAIEQYQRYPLANHLHWLSKGQPGGHAKWSFLDTQLLRDAYHAALAAIGKCDTLIAHLESNEQ